MKIGIAGCLLLGAVTLPALSLSATPNACNRDCLEGYVNRYLEAMQWTP